MRVTGCLAEVVLRVQQKLGPLYNLDLRPEEILIGLSDELNQQGAYQGLKQTTAAWCNRPGYLCFDVNFAKRPYHEVMKVGSDGKVQYWWIHAAQPQKT